MKEFLKEPIFLLMISYYTGMAAHAYPSLTIPLTLSLGLVLYFWTIPCKEKK